MVYTYDSKSYGRKSMRVRLPLPALMKWSPNLAYAIGLVATDGNLSQDGRHITLTSADKSLLQTFAKCLQKNSKITPNPKGGFPNSKPAYRIQFSDAKFYRSLIKIGLTPNKSLTIGRINIDNKHFRDFLRGHLDGDGSVIHYKDKYLTHLNKKYVYDRLFLYFISSSKKHLVWLRNEIFKLICIKGSLNVKTNKTRVAIHSTYVLKFSTKEAKILLNWIYYKPDLPCLDRKYKIAKPFLQQQSS